MTETTFSYDYRPSQFADTTIQEWEDWKWQNRNSITSYEQLSKEFPDDDSIRKRLENWENRNLRISITPYLLAQILREFENGNMNGPIWNQHFPYFEEENYSSFDEYSPSHENWEETGEMITDVCQWKYDNRAIIYSIDSCFSYCTFCLRSLQSDAKEEKHGGFSLWKETLAEIAKRPEIEEVIISGGDPLMYSNAKLKRIFSSLRELKNIKAISLNTRSLTHNPYRLDNELMDIFREYRLTKLGVHVNHASEITADFLEGIKRLHQENGRTLLLAQTVLIKGVNDNVDALRELFMKLYTSGIKPYYLFHNMPNIPGARFQRTSVKKGVDLILSIKRAISNPAMPEYIIAHNSGKKTVPLDLQGSENFEYTVNESGYPVIRFKNWKGKFVEYLDGEDKLVRETSLTM